MKLKKIFTLIYSFTIFYCYNVFALEGSKTTSNDLSFNDKIIILYYETQKKSFAIL